MIRPNPQFVTDAAGERTAVQLPLADYRELVLAAFASGVLTVGEAARSLGVSRPDFYVIAAEAGVSTCTYTPESIQAEIANL